MSKLFKRLPFVVGALIGAALLVLASCLIESSAFVDGDPLKGWFSVINLHHNGFHTWRLDHLSQLAALLWGGKKLAETPLVDCFVLLIGTLLLIQATSRSQLSSPRYALHAGALAVVGVVASTGLDPVVIGTLAWIPLLAVCGLHILSSPRSPWSWVALVFLGLENCLSANQASILSGAAALGLTSLLAPRKAERSPDQSDAWVMFGVVLLIPALLTAAIAPMPLLPRYPKSSHVVPYDGVENALQPLIGPTYSFESIHHAAAREIYSYAAMVLLAGTALLFFLRNKNSPRVVSVTLATGLVLAFIAVLDTWLDPYWSQIAPVASISRLLPWGTHYSLLSIAIGAAAWALGYAAVMARPWLGGAVSVGVVALLVTQGTTELYHPFLRQSGIIANSQLEHIVLTPSAALIKSVAQHEPSVTAWLTSLQEAAHLHSTDAASIGAQVSIYPEPPSDILAKAKQIESAWRWSSRTGNQRGNELLTVKFVQPLKLRGVELDPGVYFTDYPRGLRILGGDCARAESGELLYDAPTWQGAVGLTPRGVPYFTPRNNVRVIFPKQTPSIQCLFVYQTGKAHNDWSISRVRVIE